MKLKALIIEDNEQNMYMLTFLLENNNYEVSGIQRVRWD